MLTPGTVVNTCHAVQLAITELFGQIVIFIYHTFG